MGIRVSAEEEVEGLDISEHGSVAYPDFVSTTSSIYRSSMTGGTGSVVQHGTQSAPVFATERGKS
jgi:Amt family ammonium transporter